MTGKGFLHVSESLKENVLQKKVSYLNFNYPNESVIRTPKIQ